MMKLLAILHCRKLSRAIICGLLQFFSQLTLAQGLSSELDSEKNANSREFYTETYSTPFAYGSVNFQRIHADIKKLENLFDYNLFLATESYSDPSTSNIVVELGLHKSHGEYLFTTHSLRREKLNDNQNSYWVYRSGLVMSRFFNLSPDNTFLDNYGEIFLVVPEKNIATVSASAWSKYGYRYYQEGHWSFDPIILMARFFDNTNRQLVGADYGSFNIGPQLTYYRTEPDISANLMAARSYSVSKTSSIVNPYWLLLALGVKF